jgi:PAS domain S-box-containing protein
MSCRNGSSSSWIGPVHLLVLATGALLIGAPLVDAFFPHLPAIFRNALYGLALVGTVAVLAALSWHFKGMPLRMKIMAVCLVFALCPLLLVVMVSNRLILDELHHHGHEKLQGAALQNAAALDGLIHGILDSVRTEALLPEVVNYLSQPQDMRGVETERAARNVLTALVRRDVFNISSYALLDSTGWNVLDTYARDVLPDKSGRAYFATPINAGLPYVSEVFVSPVTGKPSIVFSAPVRDHDGRRIGVLRVRYDASMLQRFVLNRTRLLGDGMFALLLDDQGIRLADGLRPDQIFAPLYALTDEEKSALRLAMRPVSGTHGAEMENTADVRRYLRQTGSPPGFMASIHPDDARIMMCEKVLLQGVPWTLVVGMPLDRAMALVRERAVLAAVLALLLSGVVATFAVATARTVSGPMMRLSEAVSRMGRGDLDQRVAVESDDETGQLALALNDMSINLSLAQTQLRDNADRLRALLDTLPDTVLVLGPKKGIEECNSRFPGMFGHSQEAAVGLDWLAISDPSQNLGRVEGFLEAAGSMRSVSFDWTCRRADGSTFPARVRLRLLKVPEGERLLAVITDVSESRRAELEAERLRLLLRETVDAMPSMLIGIDASGHVVLWNRSAEERSSVSTDQAVGNPLEVVWPDMSGLVLLVREAMEVGSTVKRLKIPRALEGGVRYEDILAYPLTGNGNAGAVVRIDDVTDRVRFEEMIVQSEKMLSLGGLAAGMAHEINNPLAAMLGSVQVIRRRLLESMPKNEQAALKVGVDLDIIGAYVRAREIPHLLDMIEDSGHRAAAIVMNMLSFSRKQGDCPDLHSLPELIEKTLGLVQVDYDLSKRYDFRRIEVVRDFAEGVGEVACEGQKVQQVLLNLIRNAAEAMAEKTYPEQVRPRLVLGLRQDGERIVISVFDNGPGIPESIRGRIFEPFFTTKAVGRGTGLGLSVSYFIVTEELGGMLRVDSSPGQWTRFEISLPLIPPSCLLSPKSTAN